MINATSSSDSFSHETSDISHPQMSSHGFLAGDAIHSDIPSTAISSPAATYFGNIPNKTSNALNLFAKSSSQTENSTFAVAQNCEASFQQDKTFQQQKMYPSQQPMNTIPIQNSEGSSFVRQQYKPKQGILVPGVSGSTAPLSSDKMKYSTPGAQYRHQENIQYAYDKPQQVNRVLKQHYIPASPQSIGGASFQHQHQATMKQNPEAVKKYKDPCILPRSCLATYGFGGNLAFMFPKRKLKLNVAGATRSPRPGSMYVAQS